MRPPFGTTTLDHRNNSISANRALADPLPIRQHGPVLYALSLVSQVLWIVTVVLVAVVSYRRNRVGYHRPHTSALVIAVVAGLGWPLTLLIWLSKPPPRTSQPT